MAPAKKHPRHHPPRQARALRPHTRRNDERSDIPADVLLNLAPINPPVAAASAPRRAVRRRVNALARAMKPQGATITKEHLLGVGANAAGGVVTALAANELVDNIGVMPMALGATIAGGLGSTLLTGRWQQVAQGVLGAGVGQLGTAYLAQRGLKKAAAASAPGASAAPAAKRNAYLASGEPDDDDNAMARAMERTERRINAMLAAERNGGDVLEVDPTRDPAAYDAGVGAVFVE